MYVIYFEIDNVAYRLPTNPEELKQSIKQKIEESEVLRLGKTSRGTTMELEEFKFEVELPSRAYHYREAKNQHINAVFYIELFKKCMTENKPIRFVVHHETRTISKMVLIESMELTEKAGEEGDYYVNFSLIEYVSHEIAEGKIVNDVVTIKEAVRETHIPKANNNVHYVQEGDTLFKIAKKYLGNGDKYKDLAKLNNITNINLLKVGQAIILE